MLKEIKYSGLSLTPSDYEAPDGELATVVNVIPENAALHPVLPPKTVLQVPQGWVLLFVHDTFQFTHYIIHCIDQQSNDYGKLRYIDADTEPIVINMEDEEFEIKDFQNTSVQKIDAVGNTLLVLTNTGMYYVLWQKGAYNNLGNHLPECDLEFKLAGPVPYASDDFKVDESDGHSAYADYAALKNDAVIISQVRQAMMAAGNSAVAKASAAHYFCFPFFLRYAYRLYDGNVTMQSAPILMIPETGKNPELDMGSSWPNSGGHFALPVTVTATVNAYKIKHEAVDAQQIETLKKWSDIITGVDIFISRQFFTYNQGAGDPEIRAYGDLPQKDIQEELETNHSFYFAKSLTADEIYIGTNTIPLPSNVPMGGGGTINNNRPRPDFYVNTEGDVILDFTTNNDTIVTREVMPDDYDSHDMLIPNSSYTFNSRVNITDIKKIVFDGFNPRSMFACPEFTNSKQTKFVVAIEDEQKDINVQSATIGVVFDSNDTVPWFYYPNIKAKVLYVVTGTTIRAFPLKRHDMLMGAYYLGYYWVKNGSYHGYSNDDAIEQDTLPTISTTDEKTISVQNKIYTSEVNNPFYFPVTSINTVSTGNILGICAAVKALSQGQFGQFPLYVFTTEGVWAMEVTATGTYSAKQPVTRDVCINPASITSLDTSVLFATDRGIMMLSGSNSLCITDALNDEQNNYEITSLISAANITTLTSLTNDAVTYIPFKQYIKNCRIIYDYTHQRIIVYNPNPSINYAYMFSLESKKWGMIVTDIKDNINSYPEAIAINADNQAVNMSVYEEGTQQAPTVVNALVMTRPLKFDMPDILKTVDTVIQRGMFQKGHVKCALFGSRDLLNWHLIYSSTDHYLRGFRGTPYKYFRVALFAQLLKEESIYGCSVQLTPRENNQPR